MSGRLENDSFKLLELKLNYLLEDFQRERAEDKNLEEMAQRANTLLAKQDQETFELLNKLISQF